MSYCRWSCDHGECDVYVYEDVAGGWTTHVAGRRLKHKVPDEIKAMYPADISAPDWVDKYMAAEAAADAWRESLPSDEMPCQRAQSDGSTKPGTMKIPKDSEYIDLREIGPEAGQSFNDGTPGECADRLVAMLAKGFNVPQRVIDALRAEQDELSQTVNEHQS